MEEILASIRQIISDDAGEVRTTSGDGGEAGFAADDDVLELTEMMNEDGSVTDLAPAPAPTPPVSAPEPEAPRQTEENRKADAAAAVKTATAAPAADGIVSTSAAGEVQEAFGGLASAVSGTRHVHLGEGDKTLEALVKEMLRPMLKAWLDDNLPPLVERLVEREIHRISGRAGED